MPERVRHLPGDSHCLVYRQLALARQPVTQRLAVDERHDIVELRVDLTRVEQRKDVRVLQPRGRFYLTQETLTAHYGGEFGAQELDRHLSIVSNIAGEVDGGHPT